MNLANAYRDSLEVLFEETARTALPLTARERMNYVRGALLEGKGFERAGIDYREKKIIRFVKAGACNEKEGIRSLDELNPAAPFTWVDPIHNRFAKYAGREVARWDLYWIWACLFGALGLRGVLALIAMAIKQLSG